MLSVPAAVDMSHADGAKAASPKINCTCRYKGEDFHLGDIVCLSTPKGPRMAQCEMALNNTSWTITDGPCPTARDTSDPSAQLAANVAD